MTELEPLSAELKKAARALGCGDDWRAALEKVKRTYVAPGAQPELIRTLADEAQLGERVASREHGLRACRAEDALGAGPHLLVDQREAHAAIVGLGTRGCVRGVRGLWRLRVHRCRSGRGLQARRGARIARRARQTRRRCSIARRMD